MNIKPHCEDGQRVLYVFDLVTTMVRQWQWIFIDELCWRNLNGMPGKFTPRFRNGWESIFHWSRITEPKARLDALRRAPKASTVNRYALAKKNELHKGRIHSKTGSGANRDWNTLIKQGGVLPDNVIEAGSEPSNVNHPAAFPIALPDFFIRAYSDVGDVWLDPFLGSGTTLVACEQTGRIGRGIEIEPKYVAVSLERLAGMGLDCHRVD